MKIKTPFGIIGIPASLGAVCFLACMGGTGEGNPEVGYLSVALRAQADAPAAQTWAGPASRTLAKTAATDTLLLFDEENTPYALHHIYAHVTGVEIVRPQGAECRDNDSVACTDSSLIVSGSRFADLLEKPSPLVLRDLPVPLGTYNRMKIRFGKLDAADTAALPEAYRPLAGHSILMRGTFAYQGVPDRPLSIYLDVDDVFGFENPAGLPIATDIPQSWAGVFLAGEWLKNLEITECLDEGHIVLGPDGGLVIDSATECNEDEIEDSLVEHVRRSTLFREYDEHDD